MKISRYCFKSLLTTLVLFTSFSNITAIAAHRPIICNNLYALCNAAACKKIPGIKGKVLCKCSVWRGKNIGYSSCRSRKPKRKPNGRTKLISTFSFGGGHYRYMACPRGVWASCLDQPCLVAKQSAGRRAYCTCKLARRSKFVTFAGNCQTKYCSRAIWSGATISGNKKLSQRLAKHLGKPMPMLPICKTFHSRR